MNNVQVADLISNECKKKNIKIALLLQDCGINHSFISDIRHKNRAPSIDKISAIADYLDVSVDYLLGRTDEPQIVSGHSIRTGNITGDNNANINTPKEKNCSNSDETTRQLVDAFQQLDFIGKAKVMGIIAELINKT